MSADELAELSLIEVGREISRRAVSPVEVVRAALDRIDRYDPVLNAYVTVCREQALRDAEMAEREIVNSDYRGPLHGVPVSVKDLFDMRGFRTTAGSRIRADVTADEDATVVRRLRAAGAVIVGKANMLEFAYGEVHPDYGPSRNPWNVAYGTSGSSSGSAAAVAAGFDYGSFGSDTGGSIRLPAAYCGTVGLKPTYGRISRAGVVPLAWSLDHVGPMTRTVGDAAALLHAVAGYDERDPGSSRQPVPDFLALLDQPPPASVVGIAQPAADDGVEADVRETFEAVTAAVADLGFATLPVELPHPVQAARALLALLYVEASAYHAPDLKTRAADYSANTRDRLELGLLLPGTRYVAAQRARRIVVDAYRELFQRIDLLLTPVGPSAAYRLEDTPAQPILESGDRMKPLIRFTGPLNLTGQPALTIPAGRTAAGLPIGVQLVGRPFDETRLLQAGAALHARLRDRVGRFDLAQTTAMSA
jgi:aspartyl-tRNA(Asn)/glutamyl-tRNA(Gln) amidotransferase subunit A